MNIAIFLYRYTVVLTLSLPCTRTSKLSRVSCYQPKAESSTLKK